MNIPKYFRLLLTFALACSPILIDSCSRQPAPAETSTLAPAVSTVELTRGTVAKTISIDGSLGVMPGESATLSPQVGGTLQSLAVKFGQRVAQGQFIAQIAQAAAEGQVGQAQATLAQNEIQVQQAEANALQQEAQTRVAILQAQANVKSAQATLEGDQAALDGDNAAVVNAQKNLARQQTLFSEGLVSQKDIDDAQLALETAKSQADVLKKQIEGQVETIQALQQSVEAAKAGTLLDAVKQKDIQVALKQIANSQAALTAARAQNSLYTLRSPLSGEITEVGASVGESVDSTTKIVTVADLSHLQLTLEVPSAASTEIHPGQTVTFTTDQVPGKVFTTRVQTVASQIDTSTGAVPVMAIVDNSDARLTADTTVTATVVETRHVDVLTVPASAILNGPDAGARSVAVVGPDNVLHIVPVTVGLVVNGVAEIDSGTTPGERIAVSGQYGLADGTKVLVQDSGGSTSGGNGS